MEMDGAGAWACNAANDETAHSPESGSHFEDPRSSPTTVLGSFSRATPLPKHAAGHTADVLLQESSQPVIQIERIWAEKINVEDPVKSLKKAIQDFNGAVTPKQRSLLDSTEQEFHQILRETKKIQNAKEIDKSTKPHWQTKLQSGLSTFCRTASHYQEILDVLNQQAPEYTSAIWGAIKILLVATVNSEKLKEEVLKNIEEVGRQFGFLKLFVTLQPTDIMVQTVTTTYKAFVRFLEKAVKYYKQSAPVRIVNAIARPWELRFQPIISEIQENVAKVKDLANAGHMVTSNETLTSCHKLEDNQMVIVQDISMLTKGAGDIQKKQDIMHQMLAQHIANSKEARDFLKSIWAAEKPINVEEKEEDVLTYYLKPDNRVWMFRDKVFPELHKLDGSLGNLIHPRLLQEDSRSISAANLQRYEEVKAWIVGVESRVLWIDGFAENGPSSWTTQFCLTLEGAAISFEDITTLSFYCNEYAHSPWLVRPEMILQSFIFQIIEAHSKRFTWSSCRSHNLTRLRFQEARNKLSLLWDILQDCFLVARISCPYIILDNVNSLWSAVSNRNEDIEKFEDLIRSLGLLGQRTNMLCKVLITSQLPDALQHLRRVDSIPPSMTRHVVTIPRSTIRDPPTFCPSKRIYRVPIRRRTVSAAIPDPETILANVDQSDEDANSEREDGESSTIHRPVDSDDDGDDDLDDGSDLSDYLNGTWSPENDSEPVRQIYRRNERDSDVEDDADYERISDRFLLIDSKEGVINPDMVTTTTTVAYVDSDECVSDTDIT